jgi:hypothetical protein
MAAISKQEVAERVASGEWRETFTSVDYSFPIDVTRIREILLNNPLRWRQTLVPISIEVVEFLNRVREIDAQRVMALTTEQLSEPVFVATFEDGKEGVCPIDGHHRIIRLFRQGHHGVLAYLIPWYELPKAANKLVIEWGNRQVDLKTKGWRDGDGD